MWVHLDFVHVNTVSCHTVSKAIKLSHMIGMIEV